MQRVTSLLPTWERRKSTNNANGKAKETNSPLEMKDEEARPSSKSSSSTNGESVHFGIPEPDDPDPFGVLALQHAGLEIREAGSHTRVDSTQFEFRPSPKSPIFTHMKRGSVETTYSSRASYLSNSKRASMLSTVQSVSHGTQTEEDLATPLSTPSLKDESRAGDENFKTVEYKEVDYTKIDLGPYNNLGREYNLPTVSPPKESNIETTNGTGNKVEAAKEKTDDEFEDVDLAKTNGTTTSRKASRKEESSEVFHSDSEDDGFSDSEVVICEAATTATAVRQQGLLSPSRVNVVKAKGNVVNIKARPPPPVPPRSSARMSRTMSHGSSFVPSPLGSPMKDGFGAETASLNGDELRLSRANTKETIVEEKAENEKVTNENEEKPKQFDGPEDTTPKYVDVSNQTTKSLKRPALNPNRDASSSWRAASLPRFDKMEHTIAATETTSTVNGDNAPEKATKVEVAENKAEAEVSKTEDSAATPEDYLNTKTVDVEDNEKPKVETPHHMPGGFGSPTPQ